MQSDQHSVSKFGGCLKMQLGMIGAVAGWVWNWRLERRYHCCRTVSLWRAPDVNPGGPEGRDGAGVFGGMFIPQEAALPRAVQGCDRPRLIHFGALFGEASGGVRLIRGTWAVSRLSGESLLLILASNAEGSKRSWLSGGRGRGRLVPFTKICHATIF